MLCDWGQCCQQSRDMDAAQVPPCIKVAELGEQPTLAGPIAVRGSSSIMCPARGRGSEEDLTGKKTKENVKDIYIYN